MKPACQPEALRILLDTLPTLKADAAPQALMIGKEAEENS